VICRVKEPAVGLRVKDQGMGIKQEDSEHLFDRVENPNFRHISGFGTGLYLSSKIVRQHDVYRNLNSSPIQ
jgi:two-component system, OmpR family, sensor histidine kinase VicK